MQKAFLWIAFLFLVGCSATVPESDFLAAQEKIQELEAQADEQGTAHLSEVNQLTSEISELSTDLKETQSELVEKETSLANLSEEMNSLNQQYEDLSSSFSELQTKYDELETTFEETEEKLSELYSDRISLEAKISFYKCDERIPGMKYESIVNISEILSGWMAQQRWVERVQGTYRDSIWNNTDTKIHAVRYISSDDGNSYVDHFLVYFDEFGWTEGVFWLSGQCWLNVNS